MAWINLNASAASAAEADDVTTEATILGSINVSQFMRILKCGLPMTNTAAATLHNTQHCQSGLTRMAHTARTE